MTTYPYSELRDFILAQPDERKINMDESNWPVETATCGCVLVHFGQAKGLSIIHAGFHHLNTKHQVETRNLIHSFLKAEVETYAQAKAILTKHNQ